MLAALKAPLHCAAHAPLPLRPLRLSSKLASLASFLLGSRGGN